MTQYLGLTCEDNLRAIAEITLKDRAKQESVIQGLLSEFNLSHLKNIKADNLSGGERKKLVIARALVNNPKILLMDEPYGAVDPINIDMIKKMIPEEISKIKVSQGTNFNEKLIEKAKNLFFSLVSEKNFEEFLTLKAYNHLD